MFRIARGKTVTNWEYVDKLIGKILTPKQKDWLINFIFSEGYSITYLPQNKLEFNEQQIKLHFQDKTIWLINKELKKVFVLE